MVSDLTDLEKVPLPAPVTVIIRSGLAGLLSGVVIAVLLWVLILGATLDVFLVALAVGAVAGIAVGLVLGLLMAIWFSVAVPHRSGVRRLVTVVSVALSLLLIVWGFASEAVYFWYVPVIVGIATWFVLPLVLKPSDNPDHA